MHSRISKLTAAAVVLIVVAMGLVRMGGKDKNVALGALIESMHKMRWIHVTGTVTLSGQVLKHEGWECLDPNIDITIEPDGVIDYRNYSEGIAYTYQPLRNTITISPTAIRFGAPVLDSPTAAMEMMIASMEKEGGQVHRENVTYEGIRVQKIQVTTEHQEITLLCDPERNVPLTMDTVATLPDTGEKATAHAVLDYPTQGPADIYEVGAPRNAVVVDNRPKGDIRELMDQVQKRFDAGFPDHVALMLESYVEDANVLEPASLVIMRQNSRLKRMDRYHAFNFTSSKSNIPTLYPAIKDIWPDLTIAGAIALEGRQFAERQRVYDGSTTTQRTNFSGQVNVQTIQGDISLMSEDDSLAFLARPNPRVLMMAGSDQQVKPEVLPPDANHPDWVGFCVVHTITSPEKRLPGTTIKSRMEDYWFDPAKDYLLMKRVIREQRDEGDGSFTTMTVGTAQMPGGQWYPTVIRTEQFTPDAKRQIHRIVREQRILVDASPVFDPALFKADSLR